jgi:TIR domain
VNCNIFINYRRGEDSGVAGRLFDRLEHNFSRNKIFMDVDSIEPGLDFISILKNQVANCDILLALIGQSWLSASDEEGRRRLANQNDFVRVEIASSLAQGPLKRKGDLGDTAVDRGAVQRPFRALTVIKSSQKIFCSWLALSVDTNRRQWAARKRQSGFSHKRRGRETTAWKYWTPA